MNEFILKLGNNYQNTYRNSDTGFEIEYYTPKEIKALFPDGGVRVAGQIKCGGDEIGEVVSNNIAEPVYKPTSSPRYKSVGYAELQDGNFLVIKKDIIALIIFLVLLGLLALAGLIAGITYAVRANATPDIPSTTRPIGTIDDDAVLGPGDISVPDKINTENREIKVNGIAKMNLKAGVREQNFVFSNPEENPCYFALEVVLADSGEVIYTSKLLPPGYSISRFKLNRPLEAGTYKTVVHVKTYSFDKEQRPLNNCDIKTTIIAS